MPHMTHPHLGEVFAVGGTLHTIIVYPAVEAVPHGFHGSIDGSGGPIGVSVIGHHSAQVLKPLAFIFHGALQPVVAYTTPYAGLSKIDRTDESYQANRRFNLYRRHITDPIYFKENIRVTIQALGWRSGGRYLPRMDDISSVAYWYSDNPDGQCPPMPSANELEII